MLSYPINFSTHASVTFLAKTLLKNYQKIFIGIIILLDGASGSKIFTYLESGNRGDARGSVIRDQWQGR